MNSNTTDDIEKIIQSIRTLTTAQIRKQLESDAKRNPVQFKVVATFFKQAKERQG